MHAEQTVIPLWQLADQLAYRKSLTGLEDQPITLYHNVQKWRRLRRDVGAVRAARAQL